MMYCTGGVRCERASSLLKSQLGDDAQVPHSMPMNPSKIGLISEGFSKLDSGNEYNLPRRYCRMWIVFCTSFTWISKLKEEEKQKHRVIQSDLLIL